ncbi:MAG TPA: SDR family NAD(P)-dependent oxidoreductase, partial [Thermoanaerobaculia bacterium]
MKPTPPRRLEGKAAFVTGASRGIGEAIARRIGSEGAKVALAARDASAGSAAARIASEIGEAGGDAFAVACDVTRADSVAAAIAETVR